jgi:photosystem II stability/assembly factor-like uncharacterized protein
MTPEERDLRRALEARSGEPSPQFHARLSAALDEGRPTSNLKQAVAMVAVIAITLGTVGALMLSRNARNIALREGPVSGSRLSSPTPLPTNRDQIPMPSSAQLSAPSSNVVWALVANSALFRSTDKGNAWEQRSLPAGIGGGLLEASFVDDRQGWLLHPGVAASQCSGAGAEIWRTTDGAMTWQRVANVDQQNQASGLGFSQCKESLSFVDSTHGFVAAGDGNYSPTIYRTADGGKTWSGSRLPDPPDFKTSPGGSALRAGLVKRFGSTLYVQARGQQAGDIPDRQYMFRSTDGGATWSWMTKVPPRSIVMVTESRWLQLLIPGQSMESINSGQQWHPYESDFNTDTPVGRPQIVFADSQVGYAEGRGALQRTVDGGLHWVRVATPGTPSSSEDWPNVPGGRVGAGLTYDAKHGYLLMFGGHTWTYSDSASPPPGFVKSTSYFGLISNETWTWDGSHWTLLHPPSSPPASTFPSMAYDPHTQKVILVGAGMWAWDGITWTELHPAHLPQSASNAVLDRDLGSVVMLGVDGLPDATRLTDFVIWQWTGSDWTKSALAGNPNFRGDFGFSYDPDHHQNALIGGNFYEEGSSPLITKPVGETWLLRQGKWSQWSPGSVGPSGYTKAAYDEARHQLVVFNVAGETWTWDGSQWTKRDPQHRPPGLLSSQSLAYDPANRRIVMFGGKSDQLSSIPLNQTWAWDGIDWVRLT